MGVRAVGVAVLMVTMAGCAGGSGDTASVEATASTTASSVAQPSISSTSSTTVAGSMTSTSVATAITVPPGGPGCVPQPADVAEPDAARRMLSGASGPQQVSLIGNEWALVDDHIWVAGGAEIIAGSVGSATADAGGPTALVISEPTCEVAHLRSGPELLAMSCYKERVDMLPGPCWVTRHAPLTGELLATMGPYRDVFDVQWAGTDVVLRSVGRLEVPGRNWTTTGDFLLRGTLEGMWGVDGAVYQMHNDNTLHRYDLDGGETISRRVDPYAERVLGMHERGLLVERRVTDQPPSYGLAIWDPATLEESAARPISGPSTLLDTGEVVAQRARGGEIGWEPFTTDMSLHDVATGEETLIASVDEDVGHRAEWPTYRPRAIVDDELIIGFIHS